MKRVTLSWPGMFVVGGSTLMSWLAGTPAPYRADRQAPVSTNPFAPADESSESPPLVRLQDWRGRPATTARAERDIFSFKTPGGRGAAKYSQPEFLRPVASAPAAVPFELIGMAQDAGEDAEAATAIIAGQGQVYLVKQGDVIAGIYAVGTLSAGSVELIDLAKGGNLRLVMK